MRDHNDAGFVRYNIVFDDLYSILNCIFYIFKVMYDDIAEVTYLSILAGCIHSSMHNEGFYGNETITCSVCSYVSTYDKYIQMSMYLFHKYVIWILSNMGGSSSARLRTSLAKLTTLLTKSLLITLKIIIRACMIRVVI